MLEIASTQLLFFISHNFMIIILTQDETSRIFCEGCHRPCVRAVFHLRPGLNALAQMEINH